MGEGRGEGGFVGEGRGEGGFVFENLFQTAKSETEYTAITF